MDKAVRELLDRRASLIQHWIGSGRHTNNSGTDFGHDPARATEVLFPSDGKIHYKWGNNARIEFNMIQPDSVESTVLRKPRLLNKKKIDNSTTIIDNQSPAVIERSYEFSTNETKTFNRDIGLSVSVGFQQKISYGGAASPVSGESTFSLDVNSSYNQSQGGSTSIERDSSISVEVPPYTKMFVTQESSVSNFEQEVEVNGGIEHSIYIWSHGDCSFKFNSWTDFVDMIVGVANDDVYTWDSTHRARFKNLAAKYRSEGEWWGDYIAPAKDKQTIQYVHKTTFKDAVSGDVRVTSEESGR